MTDDEVADAIYEGLEPPSERSDVGRVLARTIIRPILDAAKRSSRREALGQAADLAKECNETHMSIHVGHYVQGRCIERTLRALMEAE